MKTRFVSINRKPDKRIKELCKELEDEMSFDPTPPPRELIGDLLLLLYSQDVQITPDDFFWRKITNGIRWKNLSLRIRYICRLYGRQMNKAQEKTEDTACTVLKFVAQMTLSRLMSLSTNPSGSSTPAEHILRNIAGNYNNRKYQNTEEVSNDYSHGLIDTYVLVIVEMLHRARNPKTFNLWLNRELVLGCLAREYDPSCYKPRLLQVVTRLGDEDEKHPGDVSSIRGITKKTREDQIPKILPYAFAPWMLEDDSQKGQIYTMDNIINRNPPCYQHFETRKPDINHRVLISFIVGNDKRGNPEVKADISGKSMAFNLLVNAGLKIPYNLIKADVAWFERRENRWNGNAFPLNTLSLTSASSEWWRNVVEINKVLPYFFARSVAGACSEYKRLIGQIDTSPSNYLMKVIAKRIYHAVFLVVVMREEEKNICLPSASLVFPRFDRKTPMIMVCCTEHSESESHGNINDFNVKLKGDVFLDLLDANVTPFPLPEAEPSDLIHNLMTMIIGPLGQKDVKH